MFTALLILAALGYLNVGHVLTTREKAKNGKKNPNWHQFDLDWFLAMLYLPVTKSVELALNISFAPSLFFHRRRIEQLAEQRAQDDDPDFQVGQIGAEAALEDGSFQLPEPESQQKPESPSPLNDALTPKIQVVNPTEPSDK